MPDPFTRLGDLLLRELQAGAVEPETLARLRIAAGDDVHLLRLLLVYGYGNRLLVRRNGRLCWSTTGSHPQRLATQIRRLSGRIDSAQSEALRQLTSETIRPYEVIGPPSDESPIPPGSGLSRRELEVLAQLSEGLTARAIGRRLNITARTVAKHKQRIFRKLQTTDRLTTVLRATELGLIRRS
jgi:DNA-binding NarL/FixJ family response regulator